MKELFITVLLLHQLYLGAADDCSWFVDAVKWNHPLDGSTTVGNKLDNIDITSVIEGIDIPNLMINSPKDGFYSFPYYLRARIVCGGNLEISQEHVRSFVLSGTKPVFILDMKQDDDLTCSVTSQIRMEGILIDKNKNTDVNCPSTICSPIWIAPLPVGVNTRLMPVTVEAEGLGCEWLIARHVIHLDGFVESASSESATLINTLGEQSSFDDLSAILLDTKAYPNKFTLELSPMAVIGGFGNDLLLYSSDDFLNITLLKSRSLDKPLVCASGEYSSTKEIFDAASLSDRILLSTPVGVVQVVGKFKSVLDLDPSYPWKSLVVFDKGCVKEIIIPKQHYPKIHFVFLVTTDHKVYINDQVYHHENRQKALNLSFTEIGADVGGVCAATGDPYCHVVSLDVLPTGFVNCLILLETGDTAEVNNYKLVRFKDGNFTVIYTIPKDVMTNPTHNLHVLLEETKLVNSDEEPISKTLHITGISTTAHISSEVYLWGSHLIQSFDAGQSFILMNSYTSDSNITLFTSSLNGIFIILNDKQEIWTGVMDSWFVSRIYPSAAWSTYMLTNINYLIGKDYKTLSLYFDLHNEVNQLIGYKDDAGKVIIKHRKLPFTPILGSVIFDSVIRKDPRKLSEEVDKEAAGTSDYALVSHENRCPFFNILFLMPQNIKGFIAKEVFRFGPPRQFNGYGHRGDALKGALVHQAVTHRLLQMEQAHDRMYLDDFNSRTARWSNQRGENHGDGAYTEYRFTNGLMKEGIHLHTEEYTKEYTPQNDVLVHLPDLVYIDKNTTLQFVVELHLSSEEHIIENEADIHNMEEPQISVKVGNSSLLTIGMTRQELHQMELAIFTFDVAVSKAISMQNLPGANLLMSSVYIHVQDSLLKCVEQISPGNELAFKGSRKMNILIGCPPNYDLMFDIQASLNATADSELAEFPWDCLEVDPDFPCFYYGNVFYPFFKVIDRASGNSWRFEGNYTLKIIGGRLVTEEMYVQYTGQQVLSYNQQNYQMDQTLIWSPYNETYINQEGWFVYSSLNNAITWTCLSNSVCAYVFPKQLGDAPEYYFELEFSNIGVDSSTFCAFRKRFKVHIHGLAMNMTTMPLYIVAATTALFVLYVFIYWLFHCYDDAAIRFIWRMVMSVVNAVKSLKKTEEEEMPRYLSSMSIDGRDPIGEQYRTLGELRRATQQWERKTSLGTASLGRLTASSATLGEGSLMKIQEESSSHLFASGSSLMDRSSNHGNKEDGRYMRTEL